MILPYIDELIRDLKAATCYEERERVIVAIKQALASAEASCSNVSAAMDTYAARCCKLIDVLHHAIAALRTTGQAGIADAIQTLAQQAADYIPQKDG